MPDLDLNKTLFLGFVGNSECFNYLDKSKTPISLGWCDEISPQNYPLRNGDIVEIKGKLKGSFVVVNQLYIIATSTTQ